MRNCITHSAGKVDASFKKAAIDKKDGKDRFQEFTALKIGDRILLDEELVKKLRNAALETGLALLQLADTAIRRGD